GGKGTAADKYEAFEAAGVRTVKSPAELGTAMNDLLRRRRAKAAAKNVRPLAVAQPAARAPAKAARKPAAKPARKTGAKPAAKPVKRAAKPAAAPASRRSKPGRAAAGRAAGARSNARSNAVQKKSPAARKGRRR
ncbi:MAG: hypothetical protein ACRETR_09795, partial [Steroidobacteraceae bacterium]